MATTTDKAPDVQPVVHLNVEERVARGRAARSEVQRSALANLDPPADRDPVATLEAQSATRVAELVPIRYGRMVSSAFAFYRGGAAIMARDLSTTPNTGLRVQLVGDAHLANFGGYASPERNFVFDVNDFDETLRGPFEWDVKRFAASVEIAGRWTGLSATKRRAVVLSAVRAYRVAMREFASIGNLDVWYARADITTIMKGLPGRRDRRTLERAVEHAQTNSTAHDLESLLYDADGHLRFKPKPPLIIPVEELLEGHPDRIDHLRDIFRAYRRSLAYERRRLLEGYRYAHLARKVVGVGSVGMRSWVMLVLGRDDGDPLILQLKEATESVLEPYLGRAPQSTHAQRVVEGQRLDQAASDIFLGWTRVEDEHGTPRDYYVRQLRDWKLSIDIGTLTQRGLTTYAGWCAWSLARAHARSGDRVAIASYLGAGEGFDRAIAQFSAAYAELNERDHEALATAIRDGRIVAEEGV